MPVIKEYREPAEAYIAAIIIIVYLVVSPLFYTISAAKFIAKISSYGTSNHYIHNSESSD
jgi:hypothetical protein